MYKCLMKVVVLMLAFIFSVNICAAGEIGYGKIIAIKQYDFNNHKAIKIYLDNSATLQNIDCKEAGYIRGNITLEEHDEATVNRMLSMGMSAYMSGQKVRLYSESGCEVDFISLQNTYF